MERFFELKFADEGRMVMLGRVLLLLGCVLLHDENAVQAQFVEHGDYVRSSLIPQVLLKSQRNAKVNDDPDLSHFHQQREHEAIDDLQELDAKQDGLQLVEKSSQKLQFEHEEIVFQLTEIVTTNKQDEQVVTEQDEQVVTAKQVDLQFLQQLIGNMTLQEKCSQMVSNAPRIERLGVPKYHWRNNILHGLVDNGVSTMFPQAIGLAAAWDRDMMREIGTIWANEQRAKFNQHRKPNGDTEMNYGLDLWGPNINMFMHPLWGRGQETYGEDPVLTAELAAIVVQSLQRVVNGTQQTVATPKHFDAYTIDAEPPRLEIYENITSAQLQQYYTIAFRAVVEAGASSIMCSYNGVHIAQGKYESNHPMCMSPLLDRMLRKEFGFDGYIVTDTGALDFMVTRFKRFQSFKEAAAAALKSGVDLNSGDVFNKPLLEAVQLGLVEEALLDKALHRIFSARIKLGMFKTKEEDPFANISTDILNSEKHRKVALQAAESSIVLLKNSNKILPLSLSKPKSIAIIGPAADDTLRLAGNYYGCSYGTWGKLLVDECKIESPLESISRIASKQGVSVTYAKGVDQESDSLQALDRAIEVANQSDIVIAIVGLTNCYQIDGVNNGPHCESEGKDRPDLNLPANQHVLLERIKTITGKRLIIVFSSGGPVSLFKEAVFADAILANWYGGSLAGPALANILFGITSPSGRLPVSFPTNVTQVASKFGMDLRDPPGRTYQFFTGTPLYTFGYGLSYSKFKYTNATSSNGKSVCVDVTNAGHYTSDEVVMVFATYHDDKNRIESNPLIRLVNFAKLKAVKSGYTTHVCIPIDLTYLNLVARNDPDERNELQHGNYTFFIGGRSPLRQGLFVPEDLIEKPQSITIQL